MSQYILAHDLGTSGNKATLYALDGTCRASCLCEYITYYPAPGQVEQDPWDWWQAVCDSTRQLLADSGTQPKDIACVCFSGQMMGCLLVDSDGIPLRKSIIWADTRAERQARRMEEALGMEAVYRITGHRISASYSAAKLLWVREHEPAVYDRACKLLNAKDFIVHRLTGRFATDYSDACGTNLFDIGARRWSEPILTALSIDPALLPEAHPSTDIIGGVLPEAAAACGLLAGTPVVIGGGDGSCATVGAGVVEAGGAYCVLGSSSWISTASDSPVFDPDMRTFNWIHLDPALYTPCGTMQAAGYSYRWLRDALFHQEAETARAQGVNPYELLNELVQTSEPGAGGLLYLPYLLGERSPRWNLDARGAFVGLSITTSRADMARAVLEGVGFNLKIILQSLSALQPIESVTMIGGGARGDVWMQVLADIWQKPLCCPTGAEEATSMGAAVCGGVGIGALENFRIARSFCGAARQVNPNPANAARYEALFTAFDAAYQGLCNAYDMLARYRQHA